MNEERVIVDGISVITMTNEYNEEIEVILELIEYTSDGG